MTEPYYQDDHVTLYHGDCREITEWTDADVLVTDPPYGVDYRRGSWRHGHNDLGFKGIQGDKDTGARDDALALWGGDKPALVFGAVGPALPAGWKKKALVFEKPPWSGLFGSRMPWYFNWELIFVLGTWPDQTPQRSAVVRTSEASASGANGYASGHPHGKPHDVMARLIEVCPPGVIADPFSGGGRR